MTDFPGLERSEDLEALPKNASASFVNDIVGLKTDLHDVQINAQVIKVQDELLGTSM